MMVQNILHESDVWLSQKGPSQHVVVSSRIRLARNLIRIPFSTHAKSDELSHVTRLVGDTIQNCKSIQGFNLISLHDIPTTVRKYLKESHIISPELEKGDEHRLIYTSPNCRISIMVNEEDHIRIQGLAPGLYLKPLMEELDRIDTELIEVLPIAFSEQLGFLTACPTNLGTGLRVSVMLHLPGLVFCRLIEETLKMVQPHCLTVRGFYGEDSDYTGDLFQISNEASLGKSEEDIVDSVLIVVEKIIEKEEEARQKLFNERDLAVEDAIWRSYGLLSHARVMDTQEAMGLLSRIRLGIDRGYFKDLDHLRFNKLMIEIQPAHMEYKASFKEGTERRDTVRADLLRSIFQAPGSNN